jgi:signal transduction histidine kinase
MFRGVTEERGIDLRIDRLDEAMVVGHAIRLRQVVNNLLDNALKFNRPHGWVAVDLKRDPVDQIARLRIRDSGPGISPQDIPHIFDRFYRGDKARQRDNPLHGSGLGLSICQAIVSLYGGTIFVESPGMNGTTFTVELRLAEQDASLPQHAGQNV